MKFLATPLAPACVCVCLYVCVYVCLSVWRGLRDIRHAARTGWGSQPWFWGWKDRIHPGIVSAECWRLRPVSNLTQRVMGKMWVCRDAGFCRLLVWQKLKCANPTTIANPNTSSIPNTNPNFILNRTNPKHPPGFPSTSPPETTPMAPNQGVTKYRLVI